MVLRHVDDLKISHVSKDVVSCVIDYIFKMYGREVPLTVKRGKEYCCLEMVLAYTIVRSK